MTQRNSNFRVHRGFLTRGPVTKMTLDARDDELGIGGSWPVAGEAPNDDTEIVEAQDEGETEHYFPAAEWEAVIEGGNIVVRKRDGETVGDGEPNLNFDLDRPARDSSGPPRTLAQLNRANAAFYSRKSR